MSVIRYRIIQFHLCQFQGCVNMAVCMGLLSCVAALTAWQEPYTMSKGSELEGYCIDLISELSRKLGFKYKLHLVKDNRYGSIDSSGNWNGMIGEVVRGEADLAVAPLTLTAVREQFVDMTTPFISHFYSCLTQCSIRTQDRLFFCRISPTEWAEPDTDEHSFTLLHSFWYITGALTLQGAGPHPKALSGRVVSAIWWIFAVLLLACYFGNFHSMLHSNSKHISIKSFEDLANQDVIDYGTVEAGSTMLFFKNSNNPVYRRIYERMERKKSYVSSMEEGVRRTQEGNFAFIGEAVSLDLAVARYCKLARSQEVISMRAYSIAAPLGSPLVKNLTNAILQLSESGELTYLRDKWWASSCVSADGAHVSEALLPYDLRGLFLLLGLGLGVGLLLALLELLSRARHQAKDGKKSCCSVLTSELNQRFGSRGESTEQDSSDKSKA
uniref:Si:ch211-251b21.1 n=1 Tax=Acanthochromis polyacanthus TaxID=80966 RepID=A0A3Q1GM17_9TELE